MSDARTVSLTFRPPPRVARDEEFDETLFERAAFGEGDDRPAREGLPAGFRMRHDAHYVDQLSSRRQAGIVHLVAVREIDGRYPAGNGDLHALVESISALGVIEPLIIRRRERRYELIAGARRLAAAMAAGLTEVPCIVHEADDQRAQAIADATNLRARSTGAPRGASIAEPLPGAVFTELTEHLGAISACLNLFSDRHRPLRERIAMELIEAEVQRAAWLSQALSVLAEEPPVARNTFDLASLLERVATAMNPERALARVEYDVDANGKVTVGGDEQLLSVAIAGAIAAAYALVERIEGASVVVRTSLDGKGNAVVEIAQAAVTLPASWRLRFFELSWADRPGGYRAGAGVAAAKRIAELHGGSLEMSEGDGRGCRLVLRIPQD